MTTQWTRGGNKTQGKKKNTLADLNYFRKKINAVHEFSCTCNTVCVQVTCMDITMHAICEGLSTCACKQNFVVIVYSVVTIGIPQ